MLMMHDRFYESYLYNTKTKFSNDIICAENTIRKMEPGEIVFVLEVHENGFLYQKETNECRDILKVLTLDGHIGLVINYYSHKIRKEKYFTPC